MWFQKSLHDTSAWVLYCKFAWDLQNTVLEEHLSRLVLGFTSFVLVQVINNTFYWPAFIIYRPEFVDWSKAFLKVFFILWYIFRNNFPNVCCNWSTYYIFISIFIQTNVFWNCRGSPTQMFFRKNYLIHIRYKCEEENLYKKWTNVMEIYFYFILIFYFYFYFLSKSKFSQILGINLYF